jgi:hypothetical protein
MFIPEFGCSVQKKDIIKPDLIRINRLEFGRDNPGSFPGRRRYLLWLKSKRKKAKKSLLTPNGARDAESA